MLDEASETTQATTASFGQWGQHFQKKIVQCLMSDQSWAEQMTEVLDPNYFDLKYLRYLSDRYLGYAKKYKAYPSLQLLVTIVKDELKQGSDVALREQVVGYLKELRANPDVGDHHLVKEKSLEFCRRQALKRALEKAVDLIETEKYDSIVDTIKTAVSAGTVSSLGHDLQEDVEARYVANARSIVPTGISELDAHDVLQGGAGRGELSIVIGASGSGKSHFLVDRGAHAMRCGLNVLFYTLELSEAKVGIRFDSNFLDVDSNEVVARKDEVKQFYAENNGKMGKLRIKYFPTNTPTVNTLRAHMEKLSLRGFVPDVVIVDYADIMRSSRQYDSPRFELKLVYEELRAFAAERNVVIWSASQSNREGFNAEVLDMNNMSESFGKSFICDTILTISRKSAEKSSGAGRLYVAKNRNGRDGLVFPLHIDTARSKFVVCGEQTTPEGAHEAAEIDIRKKLRDRFQQFQDLNLKKVG